jgi:hypothetical protein
MWRDDEINRLDHPAPDGYVRVAAEDPPIDKDDDYALIICHVVSWLGKGFMPAVRYFDRSGTFRPCHNGDAHRGEDRAAYDSAVTEGRKILADMQALTKSHTSPIS